MSTGYGSASWCLGTLRTGKRVRGTAAVIHRLYRMCTTERGALRGLGLDGDEGGAESELAWGFDVEGYLGAVGEATALRALPAQLAAQFEKDDCVLSARVGAAIATDTAGRTTVELACFVQLIDEAEETQFTLAVTAGEGVELVLERTGATV